MALARKWPCKRLCWKPRIYLFWNLIQTVRHTGSLCSGAKNQRGKPDGSYGRLQMLIVHILYIVSCSQHAFVWAHRWRKQLSKWCRNHWCQIGTQSPLQKSMCTGSIMLVTPLDMLNITAAPRVPRCWWIWTVWSSRGQRWPFLSWNAIHGGAKVHRDVAAECVAIDTLGSDIGSVDGRAGRAQGWRSTRWSNRRSGRKSFASVCAERRMLRCHSQHHAAGSTRKDHGSLDLRVPSGTCKCRRAVSPTGWTFFWKHEAGCLESWLQESNISSSYLRGVQDGKALLVGIGPAERASECITWFICQALLGAVPNEMARGKKIEKRKRDLVGVCCRMG